MPHSSANKGRSQLNKFRDAASELECDDDEKLFKERLGKLVSPTTVEKPLANKE